MGRTLWAFGFFVGVRLADVVSLIGLAASGDHAALVTLRDEFTTQANLAADGAGIYAAPACDLMMCAELTARLAANSPDATHFDQFHLASILLMRSGSCRTVPELQTYADVMEEEGRSILNGILENAPDFTPGVAWLLQRLADAGDDWAATALEQLIDALPANQAAEVAASVSGADRDDPFACFSLLGAGFGGVLTDTLPDLRLEPVPKRKASR